MTAESFLCVEIMENKGFDCFQGGEKVGFGGVFCHWIKLAVCYLGVSINGSTTENIPGFEPG